MRHAILIEQTKPKGVVKRSHAIPAEIKKKLDDGQYTESVYATVFPADETGTPIPDAPSVIGRTIGIAALPEFFIRWQVDPDTGIGEEYVAPPEPVAFGTPTHISDAVDAAVARVTTAYDKKFQDLLATMEAGKEDQPVTKKKGR